jgi:UDP-glucose 4-epimerase
MNPVVITGAGGFIGSAIASACAAASDVEPVGWLRPGSQRHSLQFSTIEVDLTDQHAVEAAIGNLRPRAIIHAAGRVHGSPFELYRDNTATTVTIASAILRAFPGCVLFGLGSAAEYGTPVRGVPLAETTPCRPASIYGHSKLAAANYLAAAGERGLRYNLLRIFNIVARRNSTAQVLGAFIAKAAALADQPPPRIIPMGRLDAVRDFIALDDVVHLLLRLLERRAIGCIVNACSGEARRVRDMVRFIIEISGLDYEVVEQGAPPVAPDSDMVVGNPARFLSLSGLAHFTSIEDTLADAWRQALIDPESPRIPKRKPRQIRATQRPE